eukprot:CAMPEP_0177685008 /NCGR_PEP_ID=MMETSP0447-20121125/32757_1 /TAXON_ID=0 /ORGANISM="Stygamoeba regulata, Strain BSH-02190019" /LENGTH=64 /DNA_ID=CAMNT_0019194937 /DNA_START=107 /DNA_END=297 /DNA_ORIENTATION=+
MKMRWVRGMGGLGGGCVAATPPAKMVLGHCATAFHYTKILGAGFALDCRSKADPVRPPRTSKAP